MKKATKLELPKSGYDVIQKILHAYALCGDEFVSLDSVSLKAGMHKTLVSKNSGFLASIGVLEGTRNKKLTPPGKTLALAIGNKLEDEIVRAWENILRSSISASQIIDMIRVQGNLPKANFLARTASMLGLVENKETKTGLNCLLEIFLKSGVLREQDDKLFLSETYAKLETQEEKAIPSKEIKPSGLAKAPEEETPGSQIPLGTRNYLSPSIHIDIQIHIDANASADQIDQIFLSMSKHLYGKR